MTIHERRPGERVLAVANAKWIERDGKRIFKVVSYGEGTYRGETVPEGDAVRDMPALCMAAMAAEVGHTNPTIDLDSGEVVYGCECWWGDIQAARVRLGLDKPGTEVEMATPSAHREEIRKAFQRNAEASGGPED